MAVISLSFRAITIHNGEKASVSLTVNDLKEHVRILISEGYLNLSDIAEEMTAQIKNCDKENLTRILPKETLNKLNEIYSFIEKGE
ncbi:hypothetical protein ABU178_08345 [Pantoea osteomyelitidis]|uniref:Uncharacterized protein n=1 Tax=Pantoea osteomyelitidis TaxID=3230026 RepID=A0ABW7PVC8_9GAMM